MAIASSDIGCGKLRSHKTTIYKTGKKLPITGVIFPAKRNLTRLFTAKWV